MDYFIDTLVIMLVSGLCVGMLLLRWRDRERTKVLIEVNNELKAECNDNDELESLIKSIVDETKASMEKAITQSLMTGSKDGGEILRDVQKALGRDISALMLHSHIEILTKRGVIEHDFFGTRVGEHLRYRLTEMYTAESKRGG